MRRMSVVLGAIILSATSCVAGASTAKPVKIFRDLTSTGATVTHAPRCGCARVAHRHVARHLASHRGRGVAEGGRRTIPYDYPPVENYQTIVGYTDGPRLGPGGSEGAETGYGHCRWERVSDGSGAPRWGKVCARAGYFTDVPR